jgi:hypothetical protein
MAAPANPCVGKTPLGEVFLTERFGAKLNIVSKLKVRHLLTHIHQKTGIKPSL